LFLHHNFSSSFINYRLALARLPRKALFSYAFLGRTSTLNPFTWLTIVWANLNSVRAKPIIDKLSVKSAITQRAMIYWLFYKHTFKIHNVLT
jgi:hypothetical protein